MTQHLWPDYMTYSGLQPGKTHNFFDSTYAECCLWTMEIDVP
jgi:hypothetical protein